jgi:type IV secretion system protein VirB6
MDPFSFFVTVWGAIAVPMDDGVAAVSQALTGWVDGRFQACVVAYLVITMLIASWAADEDAMLRFFRQIFLASVIFTMATNAATYNHYVTGISHGLVTSISQAVSTFLQNGQPVNADGFDALASQAFALGLAVYKTLPDYSLKAIGLTIMIAIYWLFALLAIGIMFAVYLCAYIVTDVLLAMGPLFVALYFFPFTRGWFHGWLRNLMTGILAQVFSVIVAAFFIAVMTAILRSAGRSVKAAGNVSSEVAVGILLMLIATAAICMLFNFIALYTVYMAASIAGGLAPPQPRLTRLPRSDPYPGGGGGNNQQQSTPSNTQSSPDVGGNTGPQRDYAFNRTIGSAP